VIGDRLTQFDLCYISRSFVHFMAAEACLFVHMQFEAWHNVLNGMFYFYFFVSAMKG